MRPTPSDVRNLLIVATAVAVSCATGHVDPAEAQSAKQKATKSRINVESLNVQAERLEESFVRSTAELALQYERAGEYERAKKLLESVNKLKPGLPNIKKALERLDEEILSANEIDVTVSVSDSWGPAVATVFPEKTFRIQASGTYRFVTTLECGPDGFPTATAADMQRGIPCGALMGLIVTDGKPGKAFLVGSGDEIQPKEGGILFLKVNAPTGHKSTGEIAVHLSGYVYVPK
mgnify:FL=1